MSTLLPLRLFLLEKKDSNCMDNFGPLLLNGRRPSMDWCIAPQGGLGLSIRQRKNDMKRESNKAIRLSAEHTFHYSIDVLGHCYELLRRRHGSENIDEVKREGELTAIGEELTSINGQLDRLRNRLLDELVHYKGQDDKHQGIEITKTAIANLVIQEGMYTRMKSDARVSGEFREACRNSLNQVRDVLHELSVICEQKKSECSKMITECVFQEKALDEGISISEAKEIEVRRWQ